MRGPPLPCGSNLWKNPVIAATLRNADERRRRAAAELGDHGFAADRGLANRHSRRRLLGQDRRRAAIRSGSDQFAPRFRCSNWLPRSRQYGGPRVLPLVRTPIVPLGLSMTRPLRSFSLLALSSSAFRNFPGRCSIRCDPSAHRRAVHVARKDVHEDRDAGHLLDAETQFPGRNGRPDRGNHAVGRADHQPVVHGRHPLRIAEEIGAPARQDQPDPEQEGRKQAENQRHRRKGGDETASLPDGWVRRFCGLFRRGSSMTGSS